MSRLAAKLVAALASIVAVESSCGDDEAAPVCGVWEKPGSCRQQCRDLSCCGFLPGPLGKDVDDCLDVCDRTSDNLRARLASECFLNSPVRFGWCGPERSCADVGQCLADVFEGSAVLGKASALVRVSLSPADPGGAECNEASSPQPSCSGPSGACAEEVCAALGATDLEVVLRSPSAPGGTVTWPRQRQSCVSALSQGVSFSELPPGMTSVIVTVRGATEKRQLRRGGSFFSGSVGPGGSGPGGEGEPDGGGGECGSVGNGHGDGDGDAGGDDRGGGEQADVQLLPYCRVVQGTGAMLLGAGLCTEGEVNLDDPDDSGPQPVIGLDCEAGELCADGLDNDLDGEADCADDGCPACAEAP